MKFDAHEFIQSYFDTWRESRLGPILDYYADDATIELMGVPLELVGKTMITEHFVTPFITAFPGNVHEIRTLVHSGDRIAVEWDLTVVHRAEFYGMAATNRTARVRGCSVYTVCDRHITRGVLYYNGPTLMGQLVPETGA